MKDIIKADPMKEVLILRLTFGPRGKTVKEIIEADTDPMKEVLPMPMLCFGATFAPTQKIMLSNLGSRRETMKEIFEADTVPKKEVLRHRPTFHTAPFDHFSTSNRSKL